ncbi:MAG: primosomal protein N' [Saccharofermentanales bacterium]
MRIAKVVLRESVRQTDKLFSYVVDSSCLFCELLIGHYVFVPFGRSNKQVLAVVVEIEELDDKTEDISKLKSITSIVDPLPVLRADQIQLIRKISSRYSCTMGDAISLMIPSVVGKKKQKTEKVISLVSIEEARKVLSTNKLRSIMQINILKKLLEDSSIPQNTLLVDTKSNYTHLHALKQKNLIAISKRSIDSQFLVQTNQDSCISTLELEDKYLRKLKLNSEQEKASIKINEENDSPSVFLLHGITGSGKTEVYLKAAGNALKKNEGVLYLVPEISLTPQTVNWITGRFGSLCAVLHSRLKESDKYSEWNRIRCGQARIVVAPRSGIFAPIDNLKLIIIDEEHDSSYKSETFPKYSAKEIALMRAKITKANVVLGSATPAIESYYAASKGVYKLIELTKRANDSGKLPKVIPIDMRDQVKIGNNDILSIPLKIAMAKALSQKQQVMLFLNRRGFSRTLTCRACGSTCNCPNCSVGMTLHNNNYGQEQVLMCHYCGYTIPMSLAKCPSCDSNDLFRVGFGTEQLEGFLQKEYPNENVLRMDQDTITSSNTHESILASFARKEASILIGTQMIVKGLDFPDVTVVGILSADMIVNSADYRSSERAFQMITQASGRAGRGNKEGTVYIQTYNPDNDMLRFASDQDYESFYRQEIAFREAMQLPPFKAIGEVVVSSENEDDLLARTKEVGKYLRDFLSVQDAKLSLELFGPMPAVIYELRGKYRMSFTIKAVNKSCLCSIFNQIMKDFNPKYYSISVDLDPSR